MNQLKHWIRDHEKVMVCLAAIYNFFALNRIKGRKGVDVKWTGAFVKRTKMTNSGKDNAVEFGKGCRVYNSHIAIYGSGNRVKFANDCVLKDVDIWISDGGMINVGHNTHFAGKIHLACVEGKKIQIGVRCLFSNEITFRTGDSHVITDLEDRQINHGQDIAVGDHVWVGHRAIVLKGAQIGSNSIVGTGSLVTRGKFPDHVVLAGCPARVVKEHVSWRPE